MLAHKHRSESRGVVRRHSRVVIVEAENAEDLRTAFTLAGAGFPEGTRDCFECLLVALHEFHLELGELTDHPAGVHDDVRLPVPVVRNPESSTSGPKLGDRRELARVRQGDEQPGQLPRRFGRATRLL